MARRKSRSPRWPTRARASHQGRSFSACPGSGPTATTSRRTRSRAARRRWCASARSASACRRSWWPTCAPRWRRSAARFYGDPTRELRVVGVTGTNGKTTTAFLVRAHARGGRRARPGCSARSRSVVGGRRRSPSSAPRPRRSTSRRPSAACSTPATAPARWRSRSHALELRPRRRASTSPRRVFTNLTQDHLDFHEDDGELLRGQAAAVRAAAEGTGGRQPGRRRTAAGSRPSSGAPTYAIEREADYRARDVRFDPAGSALHASTTPDGPLELETPAARASSTSQNALAAVAAARALGLPPGGDRGRACGRADRVPGRFEPVDEGQRVHRARRLRAHAGLARQRAARGARARAAGGCSWCSARRRPRPRQAPADGRVARRAGRPRDRDLRQPAPRGPGRDRRRGRWPAPTGEAEREVESTGARRSPWPCDGGRAGRRGGDRRQGPRAGPGVRAAAARSRSTT